MKLYRDKQENVLPSLKDKSVDLIYTDPPFEMEYVSNIPGDIRWNTKGESESRFDSPMQGDSPGEIDWGIFARECFRVLENDRYVMLHVNIPFTLTIFPCFVESGFKYKGTVAWSKRFAIGGDISGAMKRDWEQLLYFAKGKPKMNPIEVERKGKRVIRSRISEIQDWEFPLKNAEKYGHPTQKPMALAKQVIELMSPPKGLMLDPFAGSGTSVVAAIECYRDYTAIECDKKYFEIMDKRLEEMVKG